MKFSLTFAMIALFAPSDCWTNEVNSSADLACKIEEVGPGDSLDKYNKNLSCLLRKIDKVEKKILNRALVKQKASASCGKRQEIMLASTDAVVGCWLVEVGNYRHGANLGFLKCQIRVDEASREFKLVAEADAKFCSTAGAIASDCAATCR